MCVCVCVCVCVCMFTARNKRNETYKRNLVTQPDVFIVSLFIMDDERNASGFTLHVIYVLDTVFGFVSVHRY